MKQLPDFRGFYAGGYDNNLYGKGAVSSLTRKSHRMVEGWFKESDSFGDVIEIGAGMNYHMEFVRHKWETYTLVDKDERVVKKLSKMDLPDGVKVAKADGWELDFEDNSFDRLIAVHVLEHIPQPEKALAEWSRVVRNGGVISILIPCDPGIAWRAGRRLVSRRKGIASGLHDYDMWIALEHVNGVFNLRSMVRYGFDDSVEKFGPMGRVFGVDGNLFLAFKIVNKKKKNRSS